MRNDVGWPVCLKTDPCIDPGKSVAVTMEECTGILFQTRSNKRYSDRVLKDLVPMNVRDRAHVRGAIVVEYNGQPSGRDDTKIRPGTILFDRERNGQPFTEVGRVHSVLRIRDNARPIPASYALTIEVPLEPVTVDKGDHYYAHSAVLVRYGFPPVKGFPCGIYGR